jgi:hypothetical protein
MRLKSFTGTILDIVVLIVVVAAGILQGYHFCAGDLDTYLPFILHGHDPSLFKNDLLLGTLGSHPVYIWKAMAFFLQWIDVRHLMQCAFLVQTFLIAFGAIIFFRRFFGPGRKWMLFLLMLVLPVTSGGYGVYGLNPYGYFHAGALAFGLVLITYVCIDSGFWLIGGILTGTMFLFHPVTAFYAMAFFMIRAVFDLVQKKKSGRIITGMLFLVATALPSFIPAFHSFLAPAAGGIDLHLWRQLARFRMNHGYFISAWVPDRFIQIAGCYLAIFFAFRKHPAFNRLLPIMLGVAGGLALAAIGDCFTIRFFLRLQPGRCSYFIYFLVAAFAAGAMADRALWDNGKKVRYAWSFAALIGLVMVGNAALSDQPHMTKTIITALLIVAGGLVTARYFRPVHPGFLFTCLAAIVLTSTVPRSWSLFNWTMAQNMSDPWVDVGLWCRKSVPKDETVMVPLDKENFRPWALRATYCTWKDGAPHLFCDSTLFVWWRRMQQFGVTLSSKRSEFQDLYRARAIDVARSNGIRYVVFEKQFMHTTGPLAYENRGYGVIDMNSWDGYGLQKTN